MTDTDETTGFTFNASATTVEFFITAVCCIPTGFFIIVLYSYIRKNHPSIFEIRRKYTSRVNNLEYPSFNNDFLFVWLLESWRMDTATFLKYAGIDALVFRIYLMGCLYTCLACIPYSVFVLLPIYGAGPNAGQSDCDSSETGDSADSSDGCDDSQVITRRVDTNDVLIMLSIDHVAKGSGLLWFAVIGIYLFVLVALYYLARVYLVVAYVSDQNFVGNVDNWFSIVEASPRHNSKPATGASAAAMEAVASDGSDMIRNDGDNRDNAVNGSNGDFRDFEGIEDGVQNVGNVNNLAVENDENMDIYNHESYNKLKVVDQIGWANYRYFSQISAELHYNQCMMETAATRAATRENSKNGPNGKDFIVPSDTERSVPFGRAAKCVGPRDIALEFDENKSPKLRVSFKDSKGTYEACKCKDDVVEKAATSDKNVGSRRRRSNGVVQNADGAVDASDWASLRTSGTDAEALDLQEPRESREPREPWEHEEQPERKESTWCSRGEGQAIKRVQRVSLDKYTVLVRDIPEVFDNEDKLGMFLERIYGRNKIIKIFMTYRCDKLLAIVKKIVRHEKAIEKIENTHKISIDFDYVVCSRVASRVASRRGSKDEIDVDVDNIDNISNKPSGGGADGSNSSDDGVGKSLISMRMEAVETDRNAQERGEMDGSMQRPEGYPVIMKKVYAYRWNEEKVDIVKYHIQKLKELQKEFDQEMKYMKQYKQTPCTAFVTFADIQSCSDIILNPVRFGVRPLHIEKAPLPGDMHWKNLHYRPKDLLPWKILSYIFLFLLLIFWTIPVALVQVIANLQHNLDLFFNYDMSQDWNQEAISTMEGMVSLLVLTLWLKVLPGIVKGIAKLEKNVSKGHDEVKIMQKYYLCLIVMMLFVTVVSGSFLSSHGRDLSDIELAFERIANALARMSTYFLQYLMLYAFVWLPIAFFRPSFWTKTFFHVSVPTRFNYAKWYGKTMMFLLLCMTYSVFSPVVWVAGAILFFFAIVVFTYVLSMDFFPDFQIEGAMWPPVFRSLALSFNIAIFEVIGLLIFKEAWWQAGAVLPLFVINAAVSKYIDKKFKDLFRASSVLLANDKDRLLRKAKKSISDVWDERDEQYYYPSFFNHWGAKM